MRKLTCAAIAFAMLGAAAAMAQQDKPAVDPALVQAAIDRSWPNAAPEWKERLVQDETMQQCSAYRNEPPPQVFEAIQKREMAKIKYPEDGKLMGDWKKGEKLAQSGYGLRFSDYPPRRENGGNCFACHQLTKEEVSYGTLGPSLLGYGKQREFTAEATKAAYEKIYDSHVAFPCSNMPRFGTNGVLSIDQIKDLVALLMSPDSPVNQ